MIFLEYEIFEKYSNKYNQTQNIGISGISNSLWNILVIFKKKSQPTGAYSLTRLGGSIKEHACNQLP